MDAREARDHLEMVDRILTQAQEGRPVRPYAWPFIILGTAAAMLLAGQQLAVDGHGVVLIWAGGILMVGGYASLIAARITLNRNSGRVSVAEARRGEASSAVWTAVFIAAFAQPFIFTHWASGAIWNLGGAIQMLIFGFGGDRRALAGGLILAASMPAANWSPQPGYVLAGGFILGYVVPGILRLLDRDGELQSCG